MTMNRSRWKPGLTLTEVLMATILIGIAVTAILGANGYYTTANAVSVDFTTAEALMENIRELTTTLPVVDPQSGAATFGPEEGSLASYDDVDDFDGAILSPPIDASRSQLTALASYSQVITVDNVSANNLSNVVADGSTPFYRVTVHILQNGTAVMTARWIRTVY
jgi:prepilin-type N-terminal cleavage/methylation domain-containing protein